MNECNELILKNGNEDITLDVVSIRDNDDSYTIKYKSGFVCNYEKDKILYLKSIGEYDLKKYDIYINNKKICNANLLVAFNGFYKSFEKSKGNFKKLDLYTEKEVIIEKKDLKSTNVFDYFKDVIKELPKMKLDNGEKNEYLKNYFDKINIYNDSLIEKYLKQSNNVKKNSNANLYYPFGFNISQREAVKNAFNDNVSIIEGPPGTGKTQTILNIIANAIMNNKTVAVVSCNNNATENVFEKLDKYGLGFLCARLGNSSNKKSFINNQITDLSFIEEWKYLEDNSNSLIELENTYYNLLKKQVDIAKLTNYLDNIKLEKSHFDMLFNNVNENSINLNGDSKKIVEFISEYEILCQIKGIKAFFKKIIFKYKYNVKHIKFSEAEFKKHEKMLLSQFYNKRIKEIEYKLLSYKNECLHIDKIREELTKHSINLLKFKIYLKYKNKKFSRPKYELNDLYRNSDKFINDYPVILSTTHSITNSLNSSFVYDYLIMDESSQVDVVTGTLSLSCCKNIVVVGDLKQLPNVVTSETKKVLKTVNDKYNISKFYKYEDNSFLKSIMNIFPNASRVLLKEHYRCHPSIIGFCNQKYYDGELIILKENTNDIEPLMVYKVNNKDKNNKYNSPNNNKYEANEIKNIIRNISDKSSVGIIAPFNDQVSCIINTINDDEYKVATVDKFQGQEKDIIIFSTTKKDINDFVANPNRLNVAISRAVKQFILVTSDFDDSKSDISELIHYMEYHNHKVNYVNVSSIFTFLYGGFNATRKNILAKFKRVSEHDSENLFYILLENVLKELNNTKYDINLHVSLNTFIKSNSNFTYEECYFMNNSSSHVDFLLSSKITHLPIVALEVDGFTYHSKTEQIRRDRLKDSIFKKCDIPLYRFSTRGSNEKEQLIEIIENLN